MRIGRKKFGADLSIIIPVAGNGNRMRTYGPKSLLAVGPENLINRQIRILKQEYPKAEIIVVVGFQADKIIKTLPKNIKVVENESYEDTTIIRSIYIALRITTHKNVLIVNGDLIFNENSLHRINSNGSSVIVDSNNRIKSDEVGVNIIDNKISYFSYGLKIKWAQILFLNGRELELFQNIIQENNKKNIYTFEVLNKLIDQNGIIKPLEPPGMKIVEINSIKDIIEARKII
jgi:choline kinase